MTVLFWCVVVTAAVSAVTLKSETRRRFGDELHRFEHTAAPAKYYLYTKSNPNSPKQLFLNDASALFRSYFNTANPTRFIIHGWLSHYQSDVNTIVRDGLMKSGTYNVICVDWSSSGGMSDYITAADSVQAVGKEVAKFIDFLDSIGGMPLNTLTLIGHSLGAHVSGFAAKQVARGKVGTIIGLDPAYPIFSSRNCAERLCKTDALYVEVIHTNGGLLGFLEPVGTADFYPNGGVLQPGCEVDVLGLCAHSRSYVYYAESLVRNEFRSIQCSSYVSAVSRSCGGSLGNVRMGSSGRGNTGIYYVPVNSWPPYGKG